jgi:hypothetical protein
MKAYRVFVGEVMKLTKGKANPQMVNELEKKLSSQLDFIPGFSLTLKVTNLALSFLRVHLQMSHISSCRL